MEAQPPNGAASRRSTVEMMCDILNVIGSGVEKPTLIAYRSNLSWSGLMKYLDFMTGRGLIEKKKANKRWAYHLTGRGREVLILYRNVCEGLGVQRAPQRLFTEEVVLRVAAPS